MHTDNTNTNTTVAHQNTKNINVLSVGALQTFRGNAFHNLGAAREKALCPIVFNLQWG